MSRFVRSYSSFSERRPLFAAFSTTGVIFAAGDLLTQAVIEKRPNRDETNSTRVRYRFVESVVRYSPDECSAAKSKAQELADRGSGSSDSPAKSISTIGSDPAPAAAPGDIARPSNDGFLTLNTDIDGMRLFNVWLYCTLFLGPALGVWYTRLLPYLVRSASSFRMKIAMMVGFDQLFESSGTDASFLYAMEFMQCSWTAYFRGGGGGGPNGKGSIGGGGERAFETSCTAEEQQHSISSPITSENDVGRAEIALALGAEAVDGSSSCFSPPQASERPLPQVSDQLEGLSSVLADVGHAHRTALQHTKKHFLDVYITDCMIWPFVQAANFTYVPAHLQTAVVSFGCVFWAAYLSFKNGQEC